MSDVVQVLLNLPGHPSFTPSFRRHSTTQKTKAWATASHNKTEKSCISQQNGEEHCYICITVCLSQLNYGNRWIHNSENFISESSCLCKCAVRNKTIEQKIADIVKEIQVDRKKTSVYLRKFYSAPDARPLSTGMGLTAGCILVSIGVGVVIMDSHQIVANINLFWKGLRNIFKYRWRFDEKYVVCFYFECFRHIILAFNSA